MCIFDNASSVIINNKPVKLIHSCGGEIYNRLDDSEPVNVTVRILDNNDQPITGQRINIQKKAGGHYTQYSDVLELTSNSNGEITFNTDNSFESDVYSDWFGAKAYVPNHDPCLFMFFGVEHMEWEVYLQDMFKGGGIVNYDNNGNVTLSIRLSNFS